MLFNQRSLAALAMVAFLATPAQAQDVMTLEQVHARVLAQNPQIKSYRAAIAAAQGAEQQALVRPNPDLTFDVENIAGGSPRSGIEAAEYTLGIQQQVELGGKRRKRGQVAAIDTAWVVQDAQAGMQAVLAETTAAYMRAAIAAERLDLAERRLTAVRKTQAVVKRRVAAAKSADIQSTKIDLEVTAAEVEKRRAAQAYDLAIMTLANLMGATGLGADLPVGAQDLPVLPIQDDLLVAVEKSAVAMRGDVSVKRARADFDLAQAERIADPTFSVGIRRFNEDDGTAFIAGVSMPLTLFNRNQGRIAETGARIRMAEADARSQRLQLQQEAMALLQTATRARQEVLTYRTLLLPSAQKSFTQAERGFDRGAFAFLDLLDAQRTLFDVQEGYLAALNDFYDAYAALNGLSGTYASLVQAALSMPEKEGK